MRRDANHDSDMPESENLSREMLDPFLDWLFDKSRFEFAVLVRRDLLSYCTSLLEHTPPLWPQVVADAEQARLGRRRLTEAAMRGTELVVAINAPITEVWRRIARPGLLLQDELPPSGLVGTIALATRLGATSLCAFGHDAEICLMSRVDR